LVKNTKENKASDNEPRKESENRRSDKQEEVDELRKDALLDKPSEKEKQENRDIEEIEAEKRKRDYRNR
jgi:hypothetical protein